LRKFAAFALYAAAAGLLFAQTASDLEDLLGAGEVTCSQAAFFILSASSALPGGGDAFAAAREKRWLPGRTEAGSPIRLGEAALLIMKSFGLKGGIMYSLFPGPRYACRELVHAQLIQGGSDPGRRLDGRTFLQILGRVLTFIRDDEAEEARRRLLEEASKSLRDDAGKMQGIPGSAGEVQSYEGEFQLE
jgi:hypothetical protein